MTFTALVGSLLVSQASLELGDVCVFCSLFVDIWGWMFSGIYVVDLAVLVVVVWAAAPTAHLR